MLRDQLRHMFIYDCVCVLIEHRECICITQGEPYTATKLPSYLNSQILESYFLSNLSEVTPRQQFQVRGQGAGLYHLLEPPFFMGRAKQDVIPQSGILDPGLLWHKGKGTLDRKTSRRVRHRSPSYYTVVQLLEWFSFEPNTTLVTWWHSGSVVAHSK